MHKTETELNKTAEELNKSVEAVVGDPPPPAPSPNPSEVGIEEKKPEQAKAG